ncbi:MAG: helix-turn-helix domain-containing protein [bacterium]
MDRLLTVQEIADLLGIQPSTVYQWTHEGFIPHVKLGRLVRFREGEVSQWIEKKLTPGRLRRRIDVDTKGV